MLSPPWYAAHSSTFSQDFIDSRLNWAAWERWRRFRSSCLRNPRPRLWRCPPSPRLTSAPGSEVTLSLKWVVRCLHPKLWPRPDNCCSHSSDAHPRHTETQAADMNEWIHQELFFLSFAWCLVDISAVIFFFLMGLITRTTEIFTPCLGNAGMMTAVFVESRLKIARLPLPIQVCDYLQPLVTSHSHPMLVHLLGLGAFLSLSMPPLRHAHMQRRSGAPALVNLSFSLKGNFCQQR